MLKNIKDKLANNSLIKLAFFNSTSIIIKIIASIISTKALAFFVGPSGFAFIGIFRDFLTMTVNVSSLGLQKGIVKYTAELKTKTLELNRFLSTSMFIGMIVSILIGLVIFFFSETINDYLFPNYDFSFVLRVLIFIIPLSVFNNFFVSMLNGLGYVNNIIRINILLYILNMLAVIILSYYLNTFGAFLAISFMYLLQLISIFIFKPKNISLLLKKKSFSKNYLNKLMGYTLMTIFSLLLFPLISILIRKEIINTIGEDAAGFWEAMKRISDNYLLFASSLVLLYVLPKLSEQNHNQNFKNIVVDFFKSIIPLFIVCLLLVYVFRDFIVVLIYSKEFLPTTILVKWYAIGDVFRIMGMVLAANFFATRDIKGYILTDIFLATIMYFSTIFLLSIYDLEGGGIAYFTSYFLYFILLLLVYRKKLFYKTI
ncbi:MAG: O-antigen translocase [Flavobacteriaceae bacterium]|nr:O-antigen translocase [Flavobacteriaceae bacterium]